MHIQAKANEKRHEIRCALNISVLAEVGWRKDIRAQLKNASLSGAYFTADGQVKRGETMSVKFIVDFSPLIFSGMVLPRLLGRVIRTDADGFAILRESGRNFCFAWLGQINSLVLKRSVYCDVS